MACGCRTAEIAAECGGTVIQSSGRGRARQMNEGAAAASGDLLCFLHADTLPPRDLVRGCAACLLGAAGNVAIWLHSHALLPLLHFSLCALASHWLLCWKC